MSYLVLARKWRPQSFSELLGQDHVVRTLRNALSSGKIAHAYLFSGPRGVGKTTTARLLAKALNCERGPTSDPCNLCGPCKEISEGTSIDVLEIDGASHTGVDHVRELRESARYMPTRSRHKVYIIDEVHMLSISAFNALLKILEEPPPHVIFIFATTEPHKVPLTVLSRCQRFDFRRIPSQVILQHLRRIVEAEEVKADEEALRVIARSAEGSMRDAQSLLDQAISYSGGEIRLQDVRELLGGAEGAMIQQVLEEVAKGDPKGALLAFSELFQQGVDLRYFLRELMGKVRDLLMVKVGAPDLLDSSLPEERELYRTLAEEVQVDHLQRWIEMLIRADREMAWGGAGRIIAELTLVEMARTRRLMPLEEAIELLEKLPQGGEPLRPQVKDEVSPHKLRKKQEDFSSSRPEERRGWERWEEFLRFVRGENPILASFLQQGRALLTGDGVKIAFPPGSFALERVSEPEIRRTLLDMLRKFEGDEVGLEVVTTEEVPFTEGGGEGRREEEKEESLIKDVLEIFGGRVVQVKEREQRR